MNMRARVRRIVIKKLNYCPRCVRHLGCCTNNNYYATRMMTRKMDFHVPNLILEVVIVFFFERVAGKKLCAIAGHSLRKAKFQLNINVYFCYSKNQLSWSACYHLSVRPHRFGYLKLRTYFSELHRN